MTEFTFQVVTRIRPTIYGARLRCARWRRRTESAAGTSPRRASVEVLQQALVRKSETAVPL
ncbi:hypothetical protein Cch02nite_29280 [Catellatospora chokoriensis]|uniref:Uncharacterized protein n=1 Tax=Catellatospora chokoriensis TaxID=310353 RepID=A0A8J3K6M0_9ACTN|nr:hypothetical protein Cch02nite_29280 [Catellatospora chokoriensis]